MSKVWLIARATFGRRVRSGTFLLLTIGLPLIMVGAGVIGWWSASRGDSSAPLVTVVAYVDRTGRLEHVSDVGIEVDGVDRNVEFIAFDRLARGLEAHSAGIVDGVLVVPEDYFDAGLPTYHADGSPSSATERAVSRFLLRAQLPAASDWVLDRLDDPIHVTFVARDTGARVPEGPSAILRVATPAVLAVIFGLSLFTGISQMGPAIIREKEQRAMEMIITSLRPAELIAGKVLGLMLLTFAQLSIWAAGVLVSAMLFVGGIDFPADAIPWDVIGWALLLCTTGYFLYALLAAGLGILAGDGQQARQLSGLLGFAGLAPFWATGAYVGAPDGWLAIGLTLFPLTSTVVTLMRMTLTRVPTWQLMAAAVILVMSVASTIWVVARVFRAAMLMYGQRLTPRQMWRAISAA